MIIKNTDRTLDVVFSRFKGFFFYKKPKAEAKRSYAHAVLNYKSQREPVLRHMHVTSLGLCLRVTVNENPLNHEKTTFSVLSVLLLIYDFFLQFNSDPGSKSKVFTWLLSYKMKTNYTSLSTHLSGYIYNFVKIFLYLYLRIVISSNNCHYGW